MTKAHDAADAIRRLAKLYEGMAYAAEALERIGSFENATNEAIAAKEKAEAERDTLLSEAKAATDAAAQSIADAALTVDELLKSANQQAADIVAEATAKGQDAFERAIASANREAQAIVAGAQRSAEDAVALLQSTQSQLILLNGQIEDATNELGELTDQTSAAEARLAAAKESINKLLGV